MKAAKMSAPKAKAKTANPFKVGSSAKKLSGSSGKGGPAY
jgi:hypothetical protein